MYCLKYITADSIDISGDDAISYEELEGNKKIHLLTFC